METVVYITSFIQVLADIGCIFLAGLLAFQSKEYKLFYLLNFISFLAIAFADIYYNYAFRIVKLDILLSAEFISVAPLMIFQIIQLYAWYWFLHRGKVKIFSWMNLPYLLFSATTLSVIAYFFFTTDRISLISTLEDVFSVALDILVWFYAIVCFGRTKSNSIAVIALGCMMIVSASLTMTCLYRFDRNSVEITEWPHIIWAAGALLMVIGLKKSKRGQHFDFYSQNSLHVNCNWWLLMSSVIVFIIYFGSVFLLNEQKNLSEIHSVLWDVPISLMFTMIIASIFSDRFSRVILSPIGFFSQSIQSFNNGEKYEIKTKNSINEFKILGQFIEKSFQQITEKLEQEVNISAQVAHDIRSPLAALQIGIHSLPLNLDESSRILLSDAVQNIRDIANSLDKNNFNKMNNIKCLTQVAVILDGVMSERRLALSKDVRLVCNYTYDTYGYFVEAVPLDLKRILTNLINNAYEAINNNGEININVTEKESFCIISIKDNGKGISNKILNSLFQRGFTTRKEGSGLGLFHAKETLFQWGGKIDLFSTEGKGTEVSIQIPIANKPLWFISKLSLLQNEVIVCVDDNPSIYQSWKERLKSSDHNNKLIYCSSKEDFVEQLEQLKSQSVTYLIDFEFSRKNYNGIDLCNLLLENTNIKNRIFFVTSYSEKKEIQDYCVNNSVRIIPKNFAAKIPLEIFDTNKKLVVLSTFVKNEVYDQSKWITYQHASDFISDLVYLNFDVRIYIQKSMYSDYLDFELQKHDLKVEFID